MAAIEETVKAIGAETFTYWSARITCASTATNAVIGTTTITIKEGSSIIRCIRRQSITVRLECIGRLRTCFS